MKTCFCSAGRASITRRGMMTLSQLSSYDQGCVELIQNAFSDYFQGNVDFDRAKENFETAIMERYPDITAVEWAE